MKSLTFNDLQALTGTEIGVSDWIKVDQAMIDAFGTVTFDMQFIHTDPVQAKLSPFSGTIAHGFLTLSLLSSMAFSAMPKIEGTLASLNYGFDKIRFLNPVPSGARLRARFTLTSVECKSQDRLLLTNATVVEIEDAGKPALIADWLTLYFLA